MGLAPRVPVELSGDEGVWMEMGNLCLSLGWVQSKGLGFFSSPVEKILVLGRFFRKGVLLVIGNFWLNLFFIEFKSRHGYNWKSSGIFL